MTCLTFTLAGSGGAEAASRNIRLKAYVPVFCTLKRVAPYSNVHHGRGRGFGKFKIVCNTPYHMHMEGSWQPPSWPHIPFFSDKRAKKDGKDLDVELRIVGDESTLDARCELAPGGDGSCRAFKDEEGEIPPRLAQAQVTIDAPKLADSGSGSEGVRGAEDARSADALIGRTDHARRWSRRMSLGRLPRIASAGEIPYVPRYVFDAASNDAPTTNLFERSGDDAGESVDEHITVYLTLTGRY